MSVIDFHRVSLQFSGADRPVLRDCSFAVKSGELVVILGPSGCGKTTLLKLVNRLYEATAGTITIDGRDIRQQSVTTLRRQIGYVIQQVGLFPHMTVAQNIGVVPKLLGWTRLKIRTRVEELLLLVQLPPADYRDRYPAQLSGGQQQRVGLARALAGNPDILLMDEPFGALDAITRASLQDEMLRLQDQLHKTIVFVSHDVDEALRLADRILILKAGEVVQFDTPLQILTHPANGFVHELVGATDQVRQLGLLRVESVMISLTANSSLAGPSISSQATLRTALSTLLQTGASALTVVEGEQPVGRITWDQIQQVTQGPPEP